MTRRANQRHDAIIAARVIGGGQCLVEAGRIQSRTRKRKLLKKQKEGKKMRQFGKADTPQEAFIAALKVDS